MEKYSRSSRTLILTEDYYGKPFFRKLIMRLKREKIISAKTYIKVRWFPGKNATQNFFGLLMHL